MHSLGKCIYVLGGCAYILSAQSCTFHNIYIPLVFLQLDHLGFSNQGRVFNVVTTLDKT